jgi:hypothetical protein
MSEAVPKKVPFAFCILYFACIIYFNLRVKNFGEGKGKKSPRGSMEK